MATKPNRHHLDSRAAELAELAERGSPDDLLPTRETADLIGTSHQWLEIGRTKGYGPPFVRISPRCIRYRRSAIITWLDSRTFNSTAEYVSRGRVDLP